MDDACSSTDAHTVPAARESGFVYVLSLSLNKEGTKESQPRRSLLELPWRAPKLSALSHLQCFGEDKQIQTLRWRFDTKTPTRKTHASRNSKRFCQVQRARFCINLKRKRESKNLCQQPTHLGRTIMRPRWRTLAKSKIPAVHR